MKARLIISGLMMAATWAILGADIVLHLKNPSLGIGGLPGCILGAVLGTAGFIMVASAKRPNDPSSATRPKKGSI